jgi:hypothetical protein
VLFAPTVHDMTFFTSKLFKLFFASTCHPFYFRQTKLAAKMWTFPPNLQMLNGLYSMNKETENEMKIVNFGDNNYTKGNVASSVENFIQIVPWAKN